MQSLHDSTRDVKEYVSLGRSLWPIYVEPLYESKVKKTVETASKRQSDSTRGQTEQEVVHHEILSALDRKFHAHLGGTVERAALTLSPRASARGARSKHCPSRVHDFPLMTKYLLMAAHLCQVNRPDRDRHMFSIHKNGKKRRRISQADAGEDVAFGAQPKDHRSTSLRPKSFPAERMFSVFISIVGLHATTHANIGVTDWDDSVRSLGRCEFYESLAQLRRVGLLNDHPSRSATDDVRMGDARFWCSITQEEANGIARRLGFPLDRYLL